MNFYLYLNDISLNKLFFFISFLVTGCNGNTKLVVSIVTI